MPAHPPPGARPASRPTRPLLLLAVAPAALVALLAATAVLCVLAAGPDAPPAARWGILAGAALLTGAVVAGAAVAAASESGTQAALLAGLSRQAARGRVELDALLRKLERGEPITAPPQPPLADPPHDAFDQLRQEITASRQAAGAAVAEAAALAGRSQAPGGADRTDVFVDLARRVQSCVHRQTDYLAEMEDEVEDPGLLKFLHHIDHQAARIHRHAENLAVLGGAVSRHPWTRPVSVGEVLRSCAAEVEHYARVRLAAPPPFTVRGHAAADLAHLLAELVENATRFSAPQTQVEVRALPVAAGLAVEVDDRGLGMTAAEQGRMNALLAGASHADAAELLQTGRVGLAVVATLARRHGVTVRLLSNVYAGVRAVVTVPHDVLGPRLDVYGAGEGGAPVRPHPFGAPPVAARESVTEPPCH